MEIAKVFTNGRSQAVRIPKEYRFDVDELYINKIGETVNERNENLEKRRIYDRLLEACTKKMLIKNSGSRAKKGNDNLKDMLDILG